MAMRFYDLIVFVHVLSAVTLIGAGLLATPTVNAAIRRSTTIDELRSWLAVGKPLGLINPLSSLTLLASGAYLSSVGDWWGAPWVQVAVLLWVANAAMALAVVKPTMKALADSAFGDGDGDGDGDGEMIGPELDRLRKSPRAARVDDVMIAGDVGVLFLMVVKPTTYLPAILAVAAAQLLMLGFRALTRKSAIAAREPAVPMGG
jgi:uncharacterized membrane protein